MPTLREWLIGDGLDRVAVEKYRRRASMPDGTEWLARHGLPPLNQIVNIKQDATPPKHASIMVPQKKQPIISGVGSEVKEILKSLKISTKDGFCECQSWINRMDEWGPEGCRERRKEILEHLDKEFDAASIATKVVALGMAIWNGIPLSLEGILDLAITNVESRVT